MITIAERIDFQKRFCNRILNSVNRDVHFNAHLSRNELVALREFEEEEARIEESFEAL